MACLNLRTPGHYGMVKCDRLHNDAIKCVLEYLRELPLSPCTISRYNIHYRHDIVPYCETNCINVFSDDALQGFVKDQMSKVKDGKLGHEAAMQHRKAAVMLADCMHGRALVWKHTVLKITVICEYYKKLIDEYSAYVSKSLSPGTVKYHVCFIRQFLAFLESCGIYDLAGLTPIKVKDFIAESASKHRSSMTTLTGATRTFLAYLNDAGLTEINADRYLVNPAPRRKKLFPCFTDDEVNAILNGIDRSTPIGKRDYSIMVTALWSGLRSTDVLGLKRLDIDWKRNVINILQDKTDTYIQIELTPKIGNAISDYILHGRPETADCEYLYVRHRCPYIALTSSGGTTILRRYFEKAGVAHEAWDGKSFHAFRRTFGTRLVRAGIPIRSVGEMLGHLDPNSAKCYVALDNDGLRECCLDISAFKTMKEGLRET